MKKSIYVIGAIVGYIIGMLWLVNFRIFTVQDIKVIFVLIAGTILLTGAAYKKGQGLEEIILSAKWNLQLTASLTVLMLQMTYFSNEVWGERILYNITLNFKPFGFALFFYLLIGYIEKQILVNNTEIKTNKRDEKNVLIEDLTSESDLDLESIESIHSNGHEDESMSSLDDERLTIDNDMVEIAKKYKLTPREKEIVQLIYQEGLSNQAISERLFIALPTTKKHIQNSFSKMNVKNRSELYRKLAEKI